MEEKLINPISADQKITVKDLSEQDSDTGEVRVKKEAKKRSFAFYVVLGVVMIVLTFSGLFLGYYIRRGQESGPEPTAEPEPTPTLVQEESTPATTIEVIKEKISLLETKLTDIDLSGDALLPPQIDYELDEIIKEVEKATKD